jgi:hypothetical protein
MITDWQSAKVTRLGATVAGSPFLVKLRYRRLHISPQIAPIAVRRPVQEFLIFKRIDAGVLVGDLVCLGAGEMTKIIDVRSYPYSLQCLLQRTAYQPTPIWTPGSPEGQINSDKSLKDVVYQSAGSALVVLEPHGEEEAGPLPVGSIDRRRSWVFSAEPLQVQTVLLVSGDYWMLTASSSVWAVSNDFRAPARRLAGAPPGV